MSGVSAAQTPDISNPMRGAFLVGALGVVYGDIGTSPIYTLRECLKSAGGSNTSEIVFGLLSLVFWSLMVVVTLKYVVFVMRADNDGEGGIMALLGLAAHSVSDPKRRIGLLLFGLIGAALFYGDGMITPGISVLSAVEGLEVATPALASFVVPIAVVVLVGLFVLQSRGSARIGAYFGPVMAVWFAALAIAGLLQVIQAPAVLAALNPVYALRFLASHGWAGFLSLTQGEGPDAVIDAVGMESMGSETTTQRVASAVQSTISASDRPYALNDAIMSCRPGGVVSVPGVYMGSSVSTAIGAFMNKGLTMKTGQTHVHKYMEKLMRLIEEAKIDPTVVISHNRRPRGRARPL